MKLVLYPLLVLLVICSACQEHSTTTSDYELPKWSADVVSLPETDSLVLGKTYLPVYSQVYSISEQRTLNLTVMASLRNVSDTHKVYITKADYYSSSGDLVRRYVEAPIALNPLETKDIVISEDDFTGGTGANFVFEWYTEGGNAPFFQGVMNSTLGQQGLSFTTEGIVINN